MTPRRTSRALSPPFARPPIAAATWCWPPPSPSTLNLPPQQPPIPPTEVPQPPLSLPWFGPFFSIRVLPPGPAASLVSPLLCSVAPLVLFFTIIPLHEGRKESCINV